MAGEKIKFVHGDEVLNVDHTPGAAVSAGDVLIVGGFCFVAPRDIEANRLGAVSAKGGVFEGLSDGTNAGGGAKVYITADAANAVSGTGAHIGRELPDNAAAIPAGQPIRFIFEPDGTSNP